MASSTSTASQGVLIDLTDGDERYGEAYQADRVVAWLRSSGGSLGERAMKCAAADLIESSELVDSAELVDA